MHVRRLAADEFECPFQGVQAETMPHQEAPERVLTRARPERLARGVRLDGKVVGSSWSLSGLHCAASVLSLQE